MATMTGRDHEADTDGCAPSLAPAAASSMIAGSFGQIGHGTKSENTSKSRHLTIEATIQL